MSAEFVCFFQQEWDHFTFSFNLFMFFIRFPPKCNFEEVHPSTFS